MDKSAVKRTITGHPASYEVLLELQRAGGELSLKRLAERTNRSPQAAHSALKVLEQVGLVERTEDRTYRVASNVREYLDDAELKSRINDSQYRLRVPSKVWWSDLLKSLSSELARQGVNVEVGPRVEKIDYPFGVYRPDLVLKTRAGELAVEIKRISLSPIFSGGPLNVIFSLAGRNLALSKSKRLTGILYVLLLPSEGSFSVRSFDEGRIRDLFQNSGGAMATELLMMPLDEDTNLTDESFVRGLASAIMQKVKTMTA